jgi:UDP-glucose 4-epimerase
MKVLVTGATAPLGAALVEALLAANDVDLVLAVGREIEGPRPHPRLVYRSADLSRHRPLHDLIYGEARELGIDTVIHGMQHRAARDRGPAVHAQNATATHDLILACQHHPTIRRFVYRSFAEIYGLHHATSNLLDEEEPLDFDPAAPQWIRDRVEADLTVCAHLAGPLAIAVVRCAEIFAPGTGSQLWDYLQSRVCVRPLGFDPMVNLLSMEDAVAAFLAAARSTEVGVFNIPGRDTLPLSCAIVESRRADIPLPGPLLAPLYGLRRWFAGFEFRYDMNLKRFHFGGVLDGTRARTLLGYVPRTSVHWPKPWWHVFAERIAGAS